ncbi:hypothetical protein FG386_003311 [Cryptosporidium ryanae]|uniref:uncharacterized protein n=1 Tax=Cryptosporidium ryanae TaxID=515981 RepID=UPI00351A760F|nr:hypothetical protein FG386_003311 [Cryptosporidium ryanae]
MEGEGSSYYSEDSERSLTSEADEWEDENELDDEYLDDVETNETREVYGIKVVGTEIKDSKHGESLGNMNILGDDLGFKVDGSDGKTSWIRVLIDNSVQIDHVTVIERIIEKIFNDSSASKFREIEFPLKIKIKDKKTKKEEILILEFKYPRGDEVLLAHIPSESKHVINSLISHLYIYKYNNNEVKFVNNHDDSEVNSRFGFKSWHKYRHV